MGNGFKSKFVVKVNCAGVKRAYEERDGRTGELIGSTLNRVIDNDLAEALTATIRTKPARQHDSWRLTVDP